MAVYTEKWPIQYALNTITELELTTTQNVQNNYTTVSYVVRVKKINNWNDHWTPSSGGSYTTLTIGGNNVLTNYRSNWTTNTGQASATAVVASGSTNVYHNADGTKKIDYKLTLNPNVSSISTMPNRIIEGSFQATTIPRASSFTLANTLTSGSNYTMTITRASTAFTHKVVRVIGGVEVAINNNASTSATINIPHSVFNNYPSSNSITATIIVRTFNGSTQIGSASKTVTVNLTSSAKPTVTGLSVGNSNSGPMSSNQFIRGVSRLTLTASSDKGSYSSTISAYEFRYKRASGTYQGEVSTTSKSYQYATFTFPNSGSEVLAVAVRVKDSRGRYSAWKETASAIRVHYYQAPTIGSITVRRVGSNNTTLQVTRNYVVTSLLEGGATQKNTASLKFQTKVLGGANPTAFNTGATSTTMTLTNSNANLNGTFSASSSYEVRAVLSDAVNTVYGSWVTVGTEFVPLDFSSKGIGIGKIHSNGSYDLEVGSGGIKSEGPMIVNGIPQEFHKRAIGDTDPSTVTTSGAARIAAGHSSLPSGANWSQMLTVYGGGDTITQMVFPYNNTGNPWVRSGNPPEAGGNGSYGPWRKLAFTDDITSIPSIPTITSGTNDNGNWYNINGVLLICWHRFSITGRLTASQMNGTWTYPMPFAYAPAVSIGSRADDNTSSTNGYRRAGSTAFHQYNESTTKTDILYAVNNGDVPTNPRKYINIFAIGTPG